MCGKAIHKNLEINEVFPIYYNMSNDLYLKDIRIERWGAAINLFVYLDSARKNFIPV